MQFLRDWRFSRNLVKYLFVAVVMGLMIKTHVIDEKLLSPRNAHQGKLGGEQFRDAFDSRMSDLQLRGVGQ